MTIADFIERCDKFAAQRGVSRVWLSKKLLADHRRLDKLARGEADIGVQRLERAADDLSALEREQAAA
jgi:hypothetical protein